MPDALILAVLAVLVFLVAFTFANVGLGGGGLYVPILLLLYVDNEDLVVPISLSLAAATAISSTWNHSRKGFVDLKIGKHVLAGALVGALLGTVFTLDVLDTTGFKWFFAGLLFLLALSLVYEWAKGTRLEADDPARMTPRRMWAAAGATAASGFVSGSAGVGGGVLNVPVLTFILGRKTRTAIGTSSLIIVPTALFGAAVFAAQLTLRQGMPSEFWVVPLLFPLALVGAFVGSRWGLNALRTRSVALLFIGLVFLADALVVLDVLGVL